MRLRSDPYERTPNSILSENWKLPALPQKKGTLRTDAVSAALLLCSSPRRRPKVACRLCKRSVHAALCAIPYCIGDFCMCSTPYPSICVPSLCIFTTFHPLNVAQHAPRSLLSQHLAPSRPLLLPCHSTADAPNERFAPQHLEDVFVMLTPRSECVRIAFH